MGAALVWNHPEVTVVLSGMNEEAHIEENLRVAENRVAGSLTEADLAVLEQARQTYRRLMKVDCTGCRYCMPCPAGVNIPECFAFYNNTAFFPTAGRTSSSTSAVLADYGGYPFLCRAVQALREMRADLPPAYSIQKRLEEVSAVMGAGVWLPSGLRRKR